MYMMLQVSVVRVWSHMEEVTEELAALESKPYSVRRSHNHTIGSTTPRPLASSPPPPAAPPHNPYNTTVQVAKPRDVPP